MHGSEVRELGEGVEIGRVQDDGYLLEVGEGGDMRKEDTVGVVILEVGGDRGHPVHNSKYGQSMESLNASRWIKLSKDSVGVVLPLLAD